MSKVLAHIHGHTITKEEDKVKVITNTGATIIVGTLSEALDILDSIHMALKAPQDVPDDVA
jgi:uncharacterized protein YqgV (UPF0045/DUF77 family)